MDRLRVAVLEDDREDLKELVRMVRSSVIAEVVAHGHERTAFMEQVVITAPDAVLLDIDLNGEEKGGIEVAKALRLPVLFISGHLEKNLGEIEVLSYSDARLPVLHLRKPADEERLLKALGRLKHEIHALGLFKPIPIRLLRTGEEEMVPPERVVFIEVDPDRSQAQSNNKRIHFTDRKPERVANLTLRRLRDFGFPEELFVQLSADCAVNRQRIVRKGADGVLVQAMGRDGKPVQHTLKVTSTYRDKLS